MYLQWTVSFIWSCVKVMINVNSFWNMRDETNSWYYKKSFSTKKRLQQSCWVFTMLGLHDSLYMRWNSSKQKSNVIFNGSVLIRKWICPTDTVNYITKNIPFIIIVHPYKTNITLMFKAKINNRYMRFERFCYSI